MGSKERDFSSVKFMGVLLIIYGIIYLVLGTLAVAGIVSSTLPAHENKEILVVVLAYVNGLLPIIIGVCCERGKVNPVIVLSAIFTVLSLVSVILVYTSHKTIGGVEVIGLGMALCTLIYSLRYRTES